MKRRILITIFFALLAYGYGNAQDKGTLDLLVSKGVITREEADKLAKGETAIVSTRNSDTKRFLVNGLVQTQYHWINSRSSEPLSLSAPAGHGFQVRRLFLGIHGDLGAGWTASIVTDLAASGPTNAQYLNEAFIAKRIEMDYISGTLFAGYRKVNFGIEENTSAARLTTVERSLVSRFFSDRQIAGSGNLGFGSRYTGLFWNGRIKQVEGLSYGLALTNAQNYSIRPNTNDNFDNTLNMWANVAYEGKVDISEEVLNYTAGFNFGYGGGANSLLNGGTVHGEIWGINPIIQIRWRKLFIWGDFIMAGVENGRNAGTQNATPYGLNIALEYRIDIGSWGEIAPSFRYAFLDTNGRGIRISDALSGAQNVDSSIANNNLYDEGQSFYIGVNWYIIGNSVKVQAGYEWVQFLGGVNSIGGQGKKADVNAFRMQMQVVF